MYPRPNVGSIYTPSLDEYLKPFVQGVSAPDKPLRELQHNILDIVGPLATVYVLSMLNSNSTEETSI